MYAPSGLYVAHWLTILTSERKACSMHKIISLWQRGGVKPELGLLLTLELGVLGV
jgi:hypothetical protein